MIDWSKPLTLCWCGFEFHRTNYPQTYLGTLARMINDMHLRTHRSEANIAMFKKRRDKVQKLIDGLPEVELNPDIIAGRE